MVHIQYEGMMSNFYTKDKRGNFVPVEINSILSKDLDNRLIIIRVGTDECPVTAEDLDETQESFAQADVLADLENVSVVITPYQVEVDILDKDKLKDLPIYIQIRGGDNINMLTKVVKDEYKRLKKKHEVVVLPTPLRIRQYREVIDTLKRCQIRRERRGRARG